MGTCCVYRTYSPDGTLLYVGSSVDPDNRKQYHAKWSPWWAEDVDYRLEWFDTRDDARAAEVVAIATEYPRWNIHGRSINHPDGPAYDYDDVAAIHPHRPDYTPGRRMTTVRRHPIEAS